MAITRRTAMIWAGLAAVAPGHAATPDALAEAIAAFAHGAVPQTGRIALTIPDLVENGNAVPVTIEVESPMTDADHVAAVTLLAPDNPLVGVVSFRFTPLSGLARVTTRVRLARSQTVVALARMTDGTVWQAHRAVGVTIGGCGS